MKTTTPIQKNAKTAGIAYLIIICTSILSMFIGPYRFIVEDDSSATFNNMAAHQFVFRAGAAYDLLMYMGVIILSVALYKILKEVNEFAALTALICRTGEALLGSLTVLISVSVIFLANGHQPVDSAQATTAFLFDAKDALLNLVFAFLGLGSVLYCYLFFRSRAIPRILSAFGILAFTLVFGESILVILFDVTSSLVTGLPAIVFEICIGLWLTIKGVDEPNIQQIKSNT